jgi:pSer/pThr/pTyr-binding forkhead associated (FHA) protein
MEEKNQPAEASGLPLQGPHWHRGQGSDRPETFVPLRLRLQPGGQTVELTTPNAVIGRHTDVDLRLPLPDVSRRHCRCFFADGLWQIVDLNSLNGIYVNGERVQQADLHQGDIIGIGGFSFEVDLTAGESSLPESHTELLRPPGAGPELRKAS